MSLYRKEIYVYDGGHPKKAVIRNYTEQDFAGLIRVQQACFPPPFPSELWWNEQQLRSHVERFPQGALCVEMEGEVVGSMTGLIVHFDPQHPDHTWEEATDGGYIRNHDPSGNTLYVVDISVHPDYRKLGLGQWLMFSMYDVVVHKRLKRLLGGGRMPGYYKYAGRMSAEQYVAAVLNGDLNDPVISFLLRCGRTPVKVVNNYLEDEQSCHYGCLMEWSNPFDANA